MNRMFCQRFWLFAGLSLVSGVHAETQQSTDPEPETVVDTAPHPCTHQNDSNGWVDRTHNWMSKTVCGPSRWVDGFFAGPNEIYSEQPGTQLRVIGASRFQEHDGDENEVKVRAKVELPNAQHRLSLMFRNDDDTSDELRNDLDSRPEEVGQNNTGYRAALRWVVDMPDRMDIDLDAGVRSELTTFFRARYRWTTPITSLATFRFTEKVYWEDPDGFGANSLFEIDRPFTERSTLRFASEWEKSEEFNEMKRDWYFNQSASVYFRLGRQSGIGASVGFDGFTAPVSAIQTVRTSVRFRRNIWRPWLFYEVEPYVFWPREENYKGVSGIVLRLELQAGLPYD